jgi:hypothetical protein
MHRTLTSAATLALASLLLAAPALAQSDKGLELIDAGDEPRAELRYAWSEGFSETTEVAIDTTLVATIDGRPEAEDELPLSAVVARTITEVDADGNARIDFSVDGPDRPEIALPAVEALPGDALASLREELASAESYSGWMLVDTRGLLLDYAVDGLSEAHAELLVQTRGLGAELMLLPEEAVGAGAEWLAYTDLFASLLDFESEATTKLVAVEGAVLSLEHAYASDVQPDLALERVGAAVGTIYSSRSVEGAGQTELDLGGLAQAGTAEVAATLIAGMTAGTGGTELELDLDMVLTATASE